MLTLICNRRRSAVVPGGNVCSRRGGRATLICIWTARVREGWVSLFNAERRCYSYFGISTLASCGLDFIHDAERRATA